MTRTKNNEQPSEVRVGAMLTIATPSGACPVKLRGTDAESVREWALALTDEGHKNMRNYTFSAIKYFVRQFYDIHGPDHKEVCRHLNEWLGE